MAQLTNEEINKIQKSADIVEIIGSHIDLVKKGKNYKKTQPLDKIQFAAFYGFSEKYLYFARKLMI